MTPATSPSNAATRCLCEPAILYHVLQELSQVDLLLGQRVCRTWRSVINSSSILLKQVYLHPGPPTTENSLQPYTRNPLLEQHFPGFFTAQPMVTGYGQGRNNLGPWLHASLLPKPWTPDPSPKEAFMRPEASWRRMLPCLPPPTGLQLQISGNTVVPPYSKPYGHLRHISFNNGPVEEQSKMSQKCLTFGTIYDIVEAIWFQSQPKRIYASLFRLPPHLDDEPPRIDPFGQATGLCNKKDRGPGCVYLFFCIDETDPSLLEKEHQKAIKQWKKGPPLFAPCKTGRARRPFDHDVFTDEFRFSNGFDVEQVAWTERFDYGSPPDSEKERKRRWRLPFSKK